VLPQQEDTTPSALRILQSADAGRADRNQGGAQGIAAAVLRLKLDLWAYMQHGIRITDEMLPPSSRRVVWYEGDALSVLDELICIS